MLLWILHILWSDLRIFVRIFSFRSRRIFTVELNSCVFFKASSCFRWMQFLVLLVCYGEISVKPINISRDLQRSRSLEILRQLFSLSFRIYINFSMLRAATPVSWNLCLWYNLYNIGEEEVETVSDFTKIFFTHSNWSPGREWDERDSINFHRPPNPSNKFRL